MSWKPGSWSGAPSDWLRGGTSGVFGGGQAATQSTIFSLHPGGTTQAQIGAATSTLDGLRQIARDTYLRGSLLEALDIQTRLRDAAKAAGTATVDDYLFLGLLNYAARRLDDGIAVLREGVAIYPNNAPMHENLGVFLLAVGDAAGMWGGVGNILPPPADLLRHYTAWRMENDHVDQDVLSETVWPTIKRDVLIHDSVFTGALGSVPFPPYGASLPGYHIGQNAFLHFTKTV